MRMLLRDDGQQQMRGSLCVVVDLVQRGAATADVVGHIFSVRRTADTGRHVGAHDLQADAVATPEQIGRRHDLDHIILNRSGRHLLLRRARQGMPGLPRLGATRIERSVRGLARQQAKVIAPS